MDRIEPIAPDRSVQRVDLTYLTPLERERERERRERERRRRADRPAPDGAREAPARTPESAGTDDAPRLDVRA